MFKKILIVEDEQDLIKLLKYNLEKEGFKVAYTSDGSLALAEIRRDAPDLVMLDLMLPGMDGLEVCRQIRRHDKYAAIPILMLTARGEEADRVVGLEIGADDYVTKPFSIRELLARIRVRLRRHTPGQDTGSKLKFGDVEVDFDKYEATRAGRRIELTGKEFDVLRLLAQHRGEIVTRDRLLDEVWGYENYPTTRTVDNHILRLRQKLEENPSDPRHILSVYGEGYKFVG